jgi:N-acetylmuramoyl-L-alanine amidase
VAPAGLRILLGSGVLAAAVLAMGGLLPHAASAAQPARITLDAGHGGSQVGAS